MVLKKVINRNASDTIKGFNFQFLVGLLFFISNIKDYESMNVEGEEDVEINCTNKEKIFIQVKETKRPFQPFEMRNVTKAMETLSENYSNNVSNTKYIVFSTNSNYPFGKSDDSHFEVSEYMNLSYDELPETTQNKIKKIIDSNEMNVDYNKLRIMKVNYIGDEETKINFFRGKAHEFLTSAGISASFFRNIFNKWNVMISRSAEEEKNFITKNNFAASTIIGVIDSFSNIDDFIDNFEINYDNEFYITNYYENYLEEITDDLVSINWVTNMWNEYRSNPSNLKIKHSELRKKFINEFDFSGLMDIIGLDNMNESDNDVCKFIVFLILRRQGLIKNVYEAMNI